MSFIKSVEINPVSFPVVKPFSNHMRQITHLNGLVIRIFTSAGIVGHSVMYGLGDIAYQRIIIHIQNNLIPRLLDNNKASNCISLHSRWNDIWPEYKYQSKMYEELYALAALDIAVWDIFTKLKDISLHKFLGGAQTKIKAYGTTGWLSFNVQELIEECRSYAIKGINAFKIRIGRKDDYQRIKAIREAMGNDFIIMLDANQRYSAKEAIIVSGRLSDLNIHWIEEPTDNNLKNIQKIKTSSKIPIALGENIINSDEFEAICKNSLTDYLQLDIPRCGGITGFIEIMRLADQYSIPICNHLFYELSSNLIAASPNGYMVEYDHLLPPEIFRSDFSVKDGYLQVSITPGAGVEITEQALKKFSLGSFTFMPE